MACTNPRPYLVPFGGGRPKALMDDEPVGPIGLLGKVVYLPCGRCLGCRISRRQDLTCLQLLESLEHDDNWFITLTYDPEHLPSDKSLHKEHLRSFFEHLRHYLTNRGKPCRYFAVGEYGEEDNRPHYHFSLFGPTLEDLGLRSDDSEDSRRDYLEVGKLVRIKEGVHDENGFRYWNSPVISSQWFYGNHKIYRACRTTFQYVAGYCTKKLFGSTLLACKEDGRIPPFFIQSRPSIGYSWWRKHYRRLSVPFTTCSGAEALINDCIEVPGMSWRIPRICSKWFERVEGRLALERVKRIRRKSMEPVPDREHLRKKNFVEERKALRHNQEKPTKGIKSDE